MLISHRKRFIYLKTLKTASTTVEAYFEPWCWPAGEYPGFRESRDERVSVEGIVGARDIPIPAEGRRWRAHMPAAEVREKLGGEWDRYYRFTTVRNPYSRLVSEFLWKFQLDMSDERACELFREWVRLGVSSGLSFDTSSGPWDNLNRYAIDGRPVVHDFVRVESLVADLKAVCRELDVPFDLWRVGHFKRRRRTVPLSAFYDQATIEVVRRLHQWEIDRFGYRLEDAE